jgi:hypothetical protein
VHISPSVRVVLFALGLAVGTYTSCSVSQRGKLLCLCASVFNWLPTTQTKRTAVREKMRRWRRRSIIEVASVCMRVCVFLRKWITRRSKNTGHTLARARRLYRRRRWRRQRTEILLQHRARSLSFYESPLKMQRRKDARVHEKEKEKHF